jgi:hypothetical protein
MSADAAGRGGRFLVFEASIVGAIRYWEQLPPGVDRVDILPSNQDVLDQMAAVGA